MYLTKDLHPECVKTFYDTCGLMGVAQLVGHRPAGQRVTSLLPSQDTCLPCEFSLHIGHTQEGVPRLGTCKSDNAKY